jgi:hypothetical protein
VPQSQRLFLRRNRQESGGKVTNETSAAAHCNLMEEIELRVEAIDDKTNGRLRMRAKIAEESCYLQLKMISELIGLGCHVINGDIATRNGRIQKAHQAD